MLYPTRVVYNGGVGGETSTQIAARVLADRAGHNTWISTFWLGANNVDQPAQIKADVAACVASLAPGNDRFIVLPVFNEAIPSELRGTTLYATIMQANSDLAATYGQRYLDMRAYLISQFNPANAQDVLDVQNDVVPSSLRFDAIHLNYTGQVLVAKRVRDFIDTKGW